MIAALIQLAAGLGLGFLIITIAQAGEKKFRAKRAARKQAQWDTHVDQAVKVSETPLYERIAQEYAKDLDAEWRQVSTGGWATE